MRRFLVAVCSLFLWSGVSDAQSSVVTDKGTITAITRISGDNNIAAQMTIKLDVSGTLKNITIYHQHTTQVWLFDNHASYQNLKVGDWLTAYSAGNKAFLIVTKRAH
jgi:hypothetical protein